MNQRDATPAAARAGVHAATRRRPSGAARGRPSLTVPTKRTRASRASGQVGVDVLREPYPIFRDRADQNAKRTRASRGPFGQGIKCGRRAFPGAHEGLIPNEPEPRAPLDSGAQIRARPVPKPNEPSKSRDSKDLGVRHSENEPSRAARLPSRTCCRHPASPPRRREAARVSGIVAERPREIVDPSLNRDGWNGTGQRAP
jgi:hypothetical protein